jgi:glycosyltransferase involved in cell wall biosynthesis
MIQRPGAEYLLYGNDGLVDLRHWRGRRLLYWYDAPWDWSQQAPVRSQFVPWLRYQNVVHADLVYAVSHCQVRVAQRLRPGRESSVFYLPVGVNCSVFDPAKANPAAMRERFCLPDKVIVGYLGYLASWEGRFAGEALIEAAPRLVARQPVHFFIVGSGPALPVFRGRVAELGLQGSFTFAGYVEDEVVPGCLAAMDICVDTLEPGFHSEARSETKLKQYMAMGRACVATAIGENCVDLDEGRCGVLVKHGPESLADGIERLCADPEVRHQLGSAARQRAEALYNWPLLARRLAEPALSHQP